MTFLQFLGYYIGSMMIYEILVISVGVMVRRQRKKNLPKTLDLDKIKLMTAEEFLAEMSKEDKKTWN